MWLLLLMIYIVHFKNLFQHFGADFREIKEKVPVKTEKIGTTDAVHGGETFLPGLF